MPWKASDVFRHNHAVKSPARKKQWSKVANAILKRTHDEGRAIRGANSVVKKSKGKRSRKRG